jgi:xanthine/uracil/vitamin C permease (AzgA family)
MPVLLAPGLGVNAYFACKCMGSTHSRRLLTVFDWCTDTVVGYAGSGRVSYQKALAAVFVEVNAPLRVDGASSSCALGLDLLRPWS